MIPNDTWSDNTKLDAYATYGISKPNYSSVYPHEIELGPNVISGADNDIAVVYWLFEYENGEVKAYKFDGENPIYIQTLFSAPKITALSATFDQLGKPLVFFYDGSSLKLWWFDPEQSLDVITEFGDGEYPFATFDLRWDTTNPNSDALLFYVRNGGIYYRQQRERYEVEYSTPETKFAKRVINADMSANYRMQIYYVSSDQSLKPADPTPPIVVPPSDDAYWSYKLSGMGSAISVGRNIIDPVLDKDYEIIVDIDSVYLDDKPSEIGIFSQNRSTEIGRYGAGLICTFGGENYDVINLVLGGRLNQFRLPWSLSAGLWSFEFSSIATGRRSFRVSVTFKDDPATYYTQWFNCTAGTNKESSSGFYFGGIRTTYDNFYKCLPGVIKSGTIKHYRFDKDLIININDKQSGELQDGYNNLGELILTTVKILDYRSSNWAFNE